MPSRELFLDFYIIFRRSHAYLILLTVTWQHKIPRLIVEIKQNCLRLIFPSLGSSSLHFFNKVLLKEKKLKLVIWSHQEMINVLVICCLRIMKRCVHEPCVDQPCSGDKVNEENRWL